MNRLGLLVAWIAATGLATTLAWQVVGAADEQISDAPTTPLIALTAPDSSAGTVTSSTSDDTTTPDTGSSGTSPTSTSPTGTSSTDSRPGGSTSTSTTVTSTTTGNNSTSTSTTNPGSSTTTTGPPVSATATAVSNGGTVTVTGTQPKVELVAVVAAPGWSYRVTTNDGTRVEVMFTNAAGAEVRVRCEWDDGRLKAEVED